MTSEVKEMPRFVTGGYGWHRRQWVKLPFVTKDSKHLVGKSGDDLSTLIEKLLSVKNKSVKLHFVIEKL